MEGLFYNGDNPPLRGNTVEVLLLAQSASSPYREEMGESAYLHLTFFRPSDYRLDLLQVLSKGPEMTSGNILRSSLLKNLTRKMKSDHRRERVLFYSLLEMFFFNNSRSLSVLFKSVEPSFVTNQEAVNPQLWAFYQKYARHLRSVKEAKAQGQTAQRTMPWPKKMREQSFYRISDAVSLVKRGRGFFWAVNLEHLTAFFGNEDHRLTELNLVLPHGEVQVMAMGLVPFSIYKLPKIILFNTVGGSFSFQVLRFKVSNKRSRYLSSIARKYRGRGSGTSVISPLYY